MRFGEPLDDARLLSLLRPGEGIDTVITADAYGAGEADRMLGRALQGVDREDYCLIGAIGHDFYTGEREGAKGYPRFTDPRLRGEGGYADYIRDGRPSAAWSAAASSGSTCCCCTTPTASATERSGVERAWRPCATPG